MSDPPVAGSPSVHIQTTEHRLTQDEVVPVFYRQALHRWQNWCLPVAGICLVIAGAAVLVLDSANKVAWVVMLTLGLVISADLLRTCSGDTKANLETGREAV